MKKKSALSGMRIRGEFWDNVQMPSDVLLGEAIMMISENRILQIQNVKGMVECSEESIRLITKKNRINIIGKKLDIREYSKEEIVIKGEIEQIIYLEK